MRSENYTAHAAGNWRALNTRRPFHIILTLVAIAIIISASGAWAQPSFTNASNLLGEDNLARTKDADVADINNDGYPDILDANANNNSNGTNVVIRFSTGSGFTTHLVGPRDNSVSYDADLVDLNADQLPDLIRTESSGSVRRIAVYRNRGGAGGKWFDLANPNFTSALDLCPDDIAFGHLNNDELIDFAVTERIGNICADDAVNQMSHTTLFFGQGDGLIFAQHPMRLPASNNMSQDQSTHDVFFLDADNDSDLDIFTVNENGVPGRLWLNSGANSPVFTVAPTSFVTAFAGQSADFNNDGLDDFVLGGSNTVTVYLNGATPGQFMSSTLGNAAAGSFYDMELGDLDRDGDIDIVGVTIDGGSAGRVRIWLNNGQGIFTPFNGTTPLPGHQNNQRLSADLIDYDRDGDLDLYVTGGDGQNLGCFGCVPNQFFENHLHLHGQVHYWPMKNGVRQGGINVYTPVSSAWNLKGAGDVNGDGTDDIIWQHKDGQAHYWPMKNGNRQGGTNIHSPVSVAWGIKAVGDINGDGTDDIIWQPNGDGTDDIVWQHNSGQVHFWPMDHGKRAGGLNIYTPVGTGWSLKGVGDLNGDENDDVVWQHQDGQVHYWPMDHGKRVGGIDIYTPVGTGWSLKGVGDVDGDGTDDIVWQHNDGQVHYWPMDHGKRVGGIDIHTKVGPGWRLKGVGDVDGDGTDDIVWQHTDGQVHYWPMDHGKRMGGIDIYTPVGTGWKLKDIGDVNGDETDDIVWQHTDGQVHYWPMDHGKRMGGIDIHTPVGSSWSLKGVGDVK